MIKAIFLVFEPLGTWERIALDQKSVSRIAIFFLTPMILLSVGVELAGLERWGRPQALGVLAKIPQPRLLLYGAVELVLNYAVIFIAAKIVKSITGTFQRRYSFVSAFTLVAYGLSPLFLVHMLDALPGMNQWVSFAIGIVLSVAVIYTGLPRLLDPDPPHAFGAFLTTAFLLIGMTGIARLASLLVLMGGINRYGPIGA